MFQKCLWLVAAIGIAGFAALSSAEAENRMALIIGNSSYQHVPALANPINDAKAVADMLKLAGFDVAIKLDLGQTEMRREVRDFAGRVADKGPDSIALIFYAGHGLQMEGESYLVPVDARIERESDVAIEAVRLSDLTKTLDDVPSRMRIIILDACRNNPFAQQANIPGHGLAIVDAPTGSIVAYSTAPGSEAEDGAGADSPFTTALLGVITERNLQIERFFKEIRLRVHKSTEGRQTPWESSSLTADFAFFGAALPEANTKQDAIRTGATPSTAATASEPASTNITGVKHERIAELRARSAPDAYTLVIEEDSIDLYQEFLRVYPSDPLAARVRGLLAQRLEMVAWYTATTLNTVESYQAFLERYPSSEYAATAKRLLERARQRGINPVTAAAFAMASPVGAAVQGSACPPSQQPQPTPIRAMAPADQAPPATPTAPAFVKPTEPPITHLEPPPIKHHEPSAVIKHHEPKVTKHHEPEPEHQKSKKAAKEPIDNAHKKNRAARNTGGPRGRGDGDRPAPSHSSDDGGGAAGALLGAAMGIAIGGGFHHGGGFHGGSGWHQHSVGGHSGCCH